jgi:transcriptional regulator with XRE-family HTH domain
MDRSKEEQAAPERIRQARERLGLSIAQVAERLGRPLAWYRDIESYPEEVFSDLSLAHLQLLGDILCLEPSRILLGDSATSPPRRGEFRDVMIALNRKMAAEGLDAETVNKRVGWEVREVLVDSQELWNFTVDGLRDVCRFAEVDWLSVLPGLPK